MTRRAFDALLLAPFLQAGLAQETYTPGPDSQCQEGVPRIYRRKIRRQGALPWQPVKPPPNV